MNSEQSWNTTMNEESVIDVNINGSITLSDKLETIRLRLENKLRLFANEWFLHENDGLNWIKRNNSNGQIGSLLEKFSIDSQIQETILADKDVDSILEFDNSFDNTTGEYTLHVEIQLKSGETLTI